MNVCIWAVLFWTCFQSQCAEDFPPYALPWMGVERAMPWEKNRRWKEPGYFFSFVMIASFLFFLSSLGLWFFRFFFLITGFLFSFSHRYTRFQNYACCGSTLLNYSLRVKDCKRYFTSVKIVTYGIDNGTFVSPLVSQYRSSAHWSSSTPDENWVMYHSYPYAIASFSPNGHLTLPVPYISQCLILRKAVPDENLSCF